MIGDLVFRIGAESRGNAVFPWGKAACLFPSAGLTLPTHVGAELDKGRGVRNAVFLRVCASASILEQQLYVWVSVFLCCACFNVSLWISMRAIWACRKKNVGMRAYRIWAWGHIIAIMFTCLKSPGLLQLIDSADCNWIKDLTPLQMFEPKE